MLPSLANLLSAVGYPAVGLLVAGESAGLPLPGETVLVAASVFAARGDLSLPLVIGAAAAGAILGDNVGFLIGRLGVRRLLTRPGRWAAKRARLVERGEAFFERHGARAVVLGRWLPGVRVVVAWVAGAHRMAWPRFLAWNALGGVLWAAADGGAAYLLGSAASGALSAMGFAGLAVTAVAAVAFVLLRRRGRKASGGGRGHPVDPPDG